MKLVLQMLLAEYTAPAIILKTSTLNVLAERASAEPRAREAFLDHFFLFRAYEHCASIR